MACDDREFLLEIDLPSSDLGNMHYPDALPEPPLSFATPQSETDTGVCSPASQDLQPIDEMGWCYYLAEISLRRTIDSIISLLYRTGEQDWLKNPMQLVHQYHELEKQRSTW